MITEFFKYVNKTWILDLKPVHRDATCQFSAQSIYYWHSSEFTVLKTCRSHLSALLRINVQFNSVAAIIMTEI